MAGKGGGAWKVAYADFVTAMMAFFMVMWIVAQSKPIKEAIAGYFNDPSGKTNRDGNGKSSGVLDKQAATVMPHGALKGPGRRDAPAKSTEDEGRGHGVARKSALLSLHNGNDLAVEAVVGFADDSATLDDRGKQVLDRLIGGLMGKWSKIEIRGHAAARTAAPDSKFHDPWQLSYARSVAVMKYLTEKGIELKRIRLSQSGPNDPAPIGQDYGLVSPNGRVEIFVLNELAVDLRQLGKDKAGAATVPANHAA